MAVCHVGETWGVHGLSVGIVSLARRCTPCRSDPLICLAQYMTTCARNIRESYAVEPY